MSVATLRALLAGDAATKALVGDKIGPLQAIVNERLPYIVLSVVSSEPYNAVTGFAGLNRTEIEMHAWAADYETAVAIATAARSAIEGAGNFTLHGPSDETAFQQDVVIYRHSYVFQIFD